MWALQGNHYICAKIYKGRNAWIEVYSLTFVHQDPKPIQFFLSHNSLEGGRETVQSQSHTLSTNEY